MGPAGVEARPTRQAVSWRKFGNHFRKSGIELNGNLARNSRAATAEISTRFEAAQRTSLCRSSRYGHARNCGHGSHAISGAKPDGGCKHAEYYRKGSAPFQRAHYGCNIGQSMGPVQQSHTDLHAHPRMRGIIGARSSEFVDDRECQQAKIAVAASLRGSFIVTSVNATCALFCQIMTCTFTMRSVHTSSREMRVRT